MLFLRLGKALALWGSVLALGTHAYFRSVSAVTLDARLPWGLPLVLGAVLLGYVLSGLLARGRKDPPPPLGGDLHGLTLLVAALCIDAFSHVEAQTSVRVLREEIPALLGWIYPALAFLTPILLRHTARSVDAADKLLWVILFLCSLSGALFLMNGPTALCLGFVTLLTQLAAGPGRMTRDRIFVLGGAVVGLLVLSSWTGLNPLHASESRAWILSAAALGLAIAVRPRGPGCWRLVVSAPLASAVVVCLCGALITAYLAYQVDLMPALNTRLTLFRQHPNFLAPFLAFQALVALGLALSWRSLRWPGLAAAALLVTSTLMTDSRTGITSLFVGLALLPGLYLLSRLARRFSLRMVFLTALAAPLLALAAGLSMGGAEKVMDLASGLERFDKSMEYRVDAWFNSLEIIGEHPGLGVGPGTFLSLRRFEPGSRFFNEPTSPHPHNVLLYVGQSAGVLAALLFVLWVLAVIHAMWQHFQWGPAPAPRNLVTALLAAIVGLLAASLLDVGLSVRTVIPGPLFLITGLLLGSRTKALGAEERLRGGPMLLLVLALGLLFVPYGYRSVRARALLEQGKLQSYLSGQRLGDPDSLKEAARMSLRHAIRSDPDIAPAYDLLARWMEGLPDGFNPARAVLGGLIARAPSYGPSHSLLGHFYVRQGKWAEATESLRASLEGSHGSVYLDRDRAALIDCLARQGLRQEALNEIADSLRLGVGILDRVRFIRDPETEEKILELGPQEPGAEPGEPIRLVEAVDVLFNRNLAEEAAGRPVGRRSWMETYTAYRQAGSNEGALAVLDAIEAGAHVDEPHTFAYERGNLALDDGRLPDALAHYEQAAALSPSVSAPFFRAQVTEVRRLMGETTTAAEESAKAFAATGEILDQPVIFRDNLELRAMGELEAGAFAGAADAYERLLLFEDDIVSRALLLERIAALHLASGDLERAERAHERALEHLGAKPYGLNALQVGQVRSIPGRIGLGLMTVWRAQGLDPGAIQRKAWKLPDFFSPWPTWSLLRMTIYAENGQPDALMREAQLQLLRDPRHSLALWAQLDALEGLGRWDLLSDTMRDVAETFALMYAIEEVYHQAVMSGASRPEDPNAWFEIALLNMLRGRYNESADMFENARVRLPDDPHEAAHMAAWQARARFLAQKPGAIEVTRSLLEEALAVAPECGLIRRRLETLPR